MRLFEEYLNRHKIDDVPIIRYSNNSCVILKTFSGFKKSNYLILNINWEDHDHHPGQFHIGYIYPIHDGYKTDRIFQKAALLTKKWNEYEDFVLEWVKEAKIEINAGKFSLPIKGDQEIVLALWEMFVFAYDSWFMKQSFDIKKTLFHSLDEDLSIAKRYKAHQDVLASLSFYHLGVLKVWRHEVLSFSNNYSKWLVDILES